MSIFPETWRSLTMPRRALPIGLVALALLSAELLAGGGATAVAIDLSLLVTFVLLGPALYRALGASLIGWAAFVGVSLVAVAVVGVALPAALGWPWTYVTEPRSLGILVTLFVVGGWGLGRDIELELGVERERARAERLAAEAESAQLLAIRAQLDPHFLFNTLNAIAEWCREDPVVAERATLDLAALLRDVFEALQRPRWLLRDELGVLRRLGELYATRDAERFVFTFDLEAEALERELPPLVLLPLFENGIKHGAAAGHRGTLRVMVSHGAEGTRVRIENPGPLGERREGGKGIALVERRLALAYGEGARLVFEALEGRAAAEVLLGPAHE